LESPEIKLLSSADARLAEVIKHYGDLSYTLHTDGFAFLAETVVGQMLSNKAADVIASRLYDICGGAVSIEAVRRLAQPTIKSIGLSDQKATYIKGLAEFVHNRPDFFEEIAELNDDALIRRLTAIRGIGAWSAKMYLIFVLNRQDVLPFEDGAFLQAYKWIYETNDVKPQTIIKKCEPWKPYSSLAARYLYRALDFGLIHDEKLNDMLRSHD
jgi:DNA-3-methyladenine glycosylase II